MNKQSNISFGTVHTDNFKPSEAKQAFTRPEQNPENWQEAVNLKQNFKKPNFSLSDSQQHNYYETSGKNAKIDGTSAQPRDQRIVNDRRLDARSSHFKVGFEPGVVAPMQGSKAQTKVEVADSTAADQNKRKMVACNVAMGSQKEETKQY